MHHADRVTMYVFEEMIEGKKLTEIINTTHENVKYLPGHKLPENVVSKDSWPRFGHIDKKQDYFHTRSLVLRWCQLTVLLKCQEGKRRVLYWNS